MINQPTMDINALASRGALGMMPPGFSNQTQLGSIAPGFAPVGHAQIPEDCTLFVGNLHSEMKDQDLFTNFEQFGKIASATVKKNHFTQESRGFGFVNYLEKASAARGKAEMNHSKIFGREIRICIRRDLSKLDKEANLYIKNISEKVTGKILEDEFIQFGEIFCCAIRYDDSNRHLGYGYVQFENKEDAAKALQEMNGKDLEGQPIIVEKFQPKGKRTNGKWKTNLYLKNFPRGWTEEKVREFIDAKMANFGVITSKFIRYNEKYNNYMAFVSFETQEMANEALKELTDYEMEDTKIFISLHESKNIRRRKLKESMMKTQNETNLFVKSIREDVDEAKLKETFSKFGEVTSVALRKAEMVPRVFSDKSVSLQYGFVNFASKEDASNAIQNGRKDADIKSLIHPDHDDRKDFICYLQNRAVREQFIKMQKKNMMTSMMLQQQSFMMQQLPTIMSNMSRTFNKQGMQQRMNHQQMMQMQAMMSSMFNAQMMSKGMDMEAMGNPMMNLSQRMQGVDPNNLNQFATSLANQQQNGDGQKDLKWLKENMREFDALQGTDKRRILGNLMYYRIQTMSNIEKDLLPKITGMLIDLDVLELTDIVEILENDEILQERVKDAIAVIQDDEGTA